MGGGQMLKRRESENQDEFASHCSPSCVRDTRVYPAGQAAGRSSTHRRLAAKPYSTHRLPGVYACVREWIYAALHVYRRRLQDCAEKYL